MIKRLVTMCAAVVLATSFARGGDPAASQPTKAPRHEETFRNLSVSVGKLPKAPTLDGTVDPAEWAAAGIAPRMIPWERGDLLTDGAGRFYFGYTDNALYIAWQLQRPKVAIAPKGTITQPDTPFFRTDDAFEFYLSCRTATKNRPVGWDYNFDWNSLGSKFDRRATVESQQTVDMKWTGPWKSVSRTVPDFGWEGEAEFPLSMLEGAEKPGPGAYWIFQLCENRATPEARVNLLGFQLNWFTAVDYPTMLFVGDQGVVSRVLDCGAMADAGKSGLVLELVNPGSSPRTVAPKLAMYKRKANSSSSLQYLRAFDQARDRSDTIAGTGARAALFVPDDKVSADFIKENYDLVKEQNDPLTLAGGKRQTIDFTIGKEPGNYLVLYEVRYAKGQAPAGEHELISGAPLPYAVPEPLEVATRNFVLVDHTIAVNADLRYVPDWQAKGTVAAKLVPAGSTETKFEKKWPGDGLLSELAFAIPSKDLAPGDFDLQLTVTDAAGKQLSTRTKKINVPATPEWFAKPVGQAPVIPPPWKPIQVSDAKKLSFLMGEVDVTDSVLPSAIRVQSIFDDKRDPILRAPVTLKGVVDGQPVQWTAPAKITEQKDDLVRVTSTATAGKVTVDATGAFEFDGMEKVTLRLAPTEGAKPALTDFTLSIPLTKECSDLYQSVTRMLGEDKVKIINGSIASEGYAHDWRPMVWIGNTRKGIEFFTENWRGWRWGKDFEKKQIEVQNGPDGVTLVVHFVAMDPAKPLVLDKPREIVFGLMFTPTRSINRHPLRHGLGYFAKDVPKQQPDRLADEVAAGVNAVEVWNNYDTQGWPDQTPERCAQLKAWDDRLEQYGVKATPYSGWYIHRKALVYPIWGPEMICEPLTDGGCGCDVCCWNSPITDAYLWTYMNAAKASGYDGYRLDAGFGVAPCQSLKHHSAGSVCGWYDDNGNLQSSLAIFGAREGAKRMYRMFHGGEVMENGICIIPPTQSVHFSAILPFFDAGISAEGSERMAKSMKEVDLSYWRAYLMQDRGGLQMLYWPKTDTLGRDSRFGVGQIHRLTPRGGSLLSLKEQSYSRAGYPVASVWKAEDWAGKLDAGTEWFGYWENKQYLDTGDPDVYGSFHVRRGEKLMLAMLNRDRKPIETTVKLDLKSLGFTGDVYAIDAIMNEPIELKDGAMTLSFTAEGFRMVKIASKPFDIVVPKKIGETLIAELDPSKWPAQGLPKGWSAEGNPTAISIVNGEICFSGKADDVITLRRPIPIAPGKHYVLEADVRLACDDGAFLGPQAEMNTFGITFGDPYFPIRTLGSQLLPRRYETFKIYFSPTEKQNAATIRLWLNGNGKVFVRNIGVYEVDKPKPPYEPSKAVAQATP